MGLVNLGLSMKIFVPPYGHANRYTIPLRFGFVIDHADCWDVDLDDALIDQEGTDNQTKRNRDLGRQHYVGTLKFRPAGQHAEVKEKIRAVIEPPNQADKLPLLVTVLNVSNTKGDNSISSYLEEMAKRGRITTEDIRTVFHEAYVKGRIQTSYDIQEIYETEIKPTAEIAPEEPGIQQNPEIVSGATENPPTEEIGLRAPMISKPLPVPKVKLTYAMADAYIENVRVHDDKIWINFIDQAGELKTAHSFKLSTRPHLKHLQDYTIQYLQDRQEQRAIFAYCTSEHCYGFLAESVTAISLQLLRAGRA